MLEKQMSARQIIDILNTVPEKYKDEPCFVFCNNSGEHLNIRSIDLPQTAEYEIDFKYSAIIQTE